MLKRKPPKWRSFTLYSVKYLLCPASWIKSQEHTDDLCATTIFFESLLIEIWQTILDKQVHNDMERRCITKAIIDSVSLNPRQKWIKCKLFLSPNCPISQEWPNSRKSAFSSLEKGWTENPNLEVISNQELLEIR